MAAKPTETDELVQKVTSMENDIQALGDELQVVRQTLAQFLAETQRPPAKHCARCGRAINRLDGKCSLGCPASVGTT